jgi:response regulator of citrate/malate metabolism
METKPIKLTWVIDDDPLQVLVLNRLLTTHKAVQASKFFSGAKSAMDSLSTNRSNIKDLPDLVFLDLIMVHGDGWDFLDYYKKIKNKLSRKARIVVISSPNDENTKRVKQYPDVFGFLSKPINVKEFEAMMASVNEKEVIQ